MCAMNLPALVLVFALAGQTGSAPGDSVPLYDNLGDYHREISTTTPAVQAYFDQGLRLYYAFNHPEAIRAFRAAARADSLCAMCYWGEALAWGPNINMPMDSAGGVAAHGALQRALAVRSHASDVERALIDALALRYAAPESVTAPRAALDSAYASAMAKIERAHPRDQDVAVLYSESLMDLRPWDYWTRDGSLQPGMSDALSLLEQVVASNPRHPGACHFYIHAVEAAHPERAVPCAERLAALMPGAGHLVHMPGHIYIRVGRYMDAVKANEHAVHADENFIRDQRPGTTTYLAGYYPHNYDFLAFAAAMAGRSEQAIGAADRQASVVPTELLTAPGMTFLQHHITRRLQLRVRFGRWQEILRAPAPPENQPHALGMWHYARGRALVATDKLREAEAELAGVHTAATDPRLAGVKLEFNTSPAILAVAEHVLAGTIASARGDHAGAISHLREAAALEDQLTYAEPPDWTVPVRHDLGATLLTARQATEAEQTYREDLKRFPDNGWSLFGLSQSLRAQGKSAEAAPALSDFRSAWTAADVEITASRF
jgi:tetratricopeptide (TPR) repeat protein